MISRQLISSDSDSNSDGDSNSESSNSDGPARHIINNYLGLNVYGLGFSLDLQQGWQADVCVHACLRVYVNVS